MNISLDQAKQLAKNFNYEVFPTVDTSWDSREKEWHSYENGKFHIIIDNKQIDLLKWAENIIVDKVINYIINNP